MWTAILSVFLGSGIGGVLRYLTAVLMQTLAGDSNRWMLPWSTLIVNVAGCFVLGYIYGLCMHTDMSRELKLCLTTGFCGGLTTFSTFSYEVIALVNDGHAASAAIYIVISLLLGFGAAAIAWRLAQ